MAMINGVNYTEVKVLFDKETRYLMYADSNGKLFYMNYSGELREWCRVWASGKVEQMTTNDVMPGGQLPFYVLGDNEQPGYSGKPNAETFDQEVVKNVADGINRVIPDDSPRVSELTMLGTSNSYDGTYLCDNAYDNEIYVDTSGRFYAKVDGGYVALYGVNGNGEKTALNLDNYYQFQNYNYVTIDGLGNVSTRISNLSKINYNAKLLAEMAGNDSFYYYLNDYDLYSVLEKNVFILKAKDDSGFYLFKDGELTHISNLYGDGTYVGYSSGHIHDDDKNSLLYTFDQVIKGKVGNFFNVYNLNTLSIPKVEKNIIDLNEDDDDFVSYEDWGDGVVGDYNFIYDSAKLEYVSNELEKIAAANEEIINAIQVEIDNMSKPGNGEEAWSGQAYNAFRDKCTKNIDEVLRDYVEIIRQMKKNIDTVNDNGKMMDTEIRKIKNSLSNIGIN